MQLKLDFSIEGSENRINFLNEYIQDQSFTNDNLEMMANYILWAVEAESNENFEIETKHSPWQSDRHISLEALAEQEQETGMPLAAILSDIQVRKTKTKLSREDIVKKLQGKAPSLAEPSRDADEAIPRQNDELISQWSAATWTWFSLWRQIDETEFMVQTWEAEHGKRRADLPIREELHARLAWVVSLFEPGVSLNTYEMQLTEASRKMNAYDYLKAKRRLVTLRTQQYDLLDGVGRAPLQTHPNMAVYWQDADLGIDAIMPLMEPMLLIDAVDEKCFEEKFQYFAVGALRTSDAIAAGSAGKAVVDLRDPEVVRQALYLLEDIDDGLEDKKVQDREISWILVKYLLYYIEQCEFSDDLKVVLEMKKSKAPNKEIVEKLKADFGLSYQENYISTIFRKRILEPIAEQAQRHYRLIEFITMGPSVFKRCSKCGKLLPRNDTYFNKRSSTSDGFVSYCKKCKTQRK